MSAHIDLLSPVLETLSTLNKCKKNSIKLSCFNPLKQKRFDLLRGRQRQREGRLYWTIQRKGWEGWMQPVKWEYSLWNKPWKSLPVVSFRQRENNRRNQIPSGWKKTHIPCKQWRILRSVSVSLGGQRDWHHRQDDLTVIEEKVIKLQV